LENIRLKDAAVQALLHLVLGSAGDAVKLICSDDDSPPPTEELDLFHVTEIKHQKGGWEVKLTDRLAAIRLLLELSKEAEDQNSGASGFYEALKNAADSIDFGDGDEV